MASAAGIGLFLTFIGLKNAGFVIAHPVTFVRFGGLSYEMGMVCLGLVVTAFLMHKRSAFAFLASIILITSLGISSDRVALPTQIFAWPDFSSVFFKLDIWDALKMSLLPTIFAITITDLFDSLSTLVGICHSAKLLDKDGEPKNLKQGLIVDAFATFVAGPLGTSPGTAFVESAAGVEVGGRSGRTAIFAALLFLPFLFIAPLAQIIPIYATSPVLILVGALMFRSVKDLSFEPIEESLPAYLTIILIPLTFSITQGILWGFISHIALHVLVGKARTISLTLYLLGALCASMLIFEAL